MCSPETLNNITIIILAHYSDHDASRVLEYYRDVNVNILVADSNATPSSHHKNYKNVQYFHYAHVPFHEKMAHIFQYVNTPYVVLHPDDDFIVPSGIVSCIEFLEKNPDYASVQGHYVWFTVGQSDIPIRPLFINVVGLDIKSTNAADRLKISTHRNMPWFYSVHRTENLKCFFQDVHSQIPNQGLGEVALKLVSAISGNLKILPVFYYAYQNYKSPNRPYVPSLIEVKTNPELREEYDVFLSLVIDYFCKKTGCDEVDGRKHVEQALEADFQSSNNKRFMTRFQMSVIRKTITNVMKRCLPDFLLQNYVEWRLHRIIGNVRGYPFFDLNAKREWENIKSVIIKHNLLSKKINCEFPSFGLF